MAVSERAAYLPLFHLPAKDGAAEPIAKSEWAKLNSLGVSRAKHVRARVRSPVSNVMRRISADNHTEVTDSASTIGGRETDATA